MTRPGATTDSLDRRVALLERLRECIQTEFRSIQAESLKQRSTIKGAAIVGGALAAVVTALLGLCVWVFMEDHSTLRNVGTEVTASKILLERVTAVLEAQREANARQDASIEALRSRK